MKRISLLGLLWVVFLVACEKQPIPEPQNPPTPQEKTLHLSCSGGIVIDALTGNVLYNHHAEVLLVPASMTKVMTMYIVFEQMEKGYMDINTVIPISDYAAQRSVNPGESNVPLSQTDTYTVNELIGALCVVSGNACAVALGEYISKGTESDFATIMNHYADSLGLDADYVDASGLASGNIISPKSQAALTRDFIRRFPLILSYTSKKSLLFHGETYYATNGLLPGQTYAYNGCDGFKTGYTGAAGLCITATAQLGGKRVIAVVMKAPDSASRYKDAATLMDYGFTKLLE